MRKIISLLLIFFLSGIPNSFSQRLKDILSEPDTFDKAKVSFKGEVIGEVLKEKDGVWINMSSGDFNIGVFLKDKKMVDKIKNFGSYKVKGDRVKIEGIFYKRCPFHFERNIHALSLEIINIGGVRMEVPLDSKKKLSFILIIICLTLGIIYFIKIKYGRAA